MQPPLALLAGVALGVIEQLLLWNYPRAGLVEVVLFVIILGRLAAATTAGRSRRTEGFVGVRRRRRGPCPRRSVPCAASARSDR